MIIRCLFWMSQIPSGSHRYCSDCSSIGLLWNVLNSQNCPNDDFFKIVFTGIGSTGGAASLPHVSLLQRRPHEQECRLLHAHGQLAVCHLVVDGAQPTHCHLRLPAAALPQEALHQWAEWGGREASMLSSGASSFLLIIIDKNVLLIIFPLRIKNWNCCCCCFLWC